MKKVTQQSRTERIGVAGVRFIFEKIGFMFRDLSIADYGIDAHIELIEEEKASGKLIALQIKSGESFFKEKTGDSIVFRGEPEHLWYWLKHSLPVMVILYHPVEEVVYWQIINKYTAIETKKGWKTEVPLTQQVNNSTANIIGQYAKKLSSWNDYTIISLHDTSHGMAKRYSAKVLLSREYTKPEIIEIIRKITEELKYREYYRNKLVKQRLEGKLANVVWLFLALSLEDIDLGNWICRTQWIDENLDPNYAPMKLDGELCQDGIVISWNNNYEVHANYFGSLRILKEDFLQKLEKVLSPTKDIVSQMIALNETYTRNQIDESSYLNKMGKLEPKLTLYMRMEVGLAPFECRELSQQFQNVMAVAHNIALPFSAEGLQTWEKPNRDYLVSSTIKDYHRELLKLEIELEKVCR